MIAFDHNSLGVNPNSVGVDHNIVGFDHIGMGVNHSSVEFEDNHNSVGFYQNMP